MDAEQNMSISLELYVFCSANGYRFVLTIIACTRRVVNGFCLNAGVKPDRLARPMQQLADLRLLVSAASPTEVRYGNLTDTQ
jgi:hypothetical protein